LNTCAGRGASSRPAAGRRHESESRRRERRGRARPSGAEVARRVLKSLADRRLIPTPGSFTQVYFEVTGQTAAADHGR
jgi:hypothetical protein